MSGAAPQELADPRHGHDALDGTRRLGETHLDASPLALLVQRQDGVQPGRVDEGERAGVERDAVQLVERQSLKVGRQPLGTVEVELAGQSQAREPAVDGDGAREAVACGSCVHRSPVSTRSLDAPTLRRPPYPPWGRRAWCRPA
jgi:hypothetical protein